MTQEELPAEAASIVHAVASAATCSSATVARLKVVLSNGDYGLRKGQSVAAESQCREPSTKPRLRNPAGNRRCREPRVKILEEPQNFSGSLSARQKSSLAKQVFNTTLQSLTAALKESPRVEKSKAGESTIKATASELTNDDAELHRKAPLRLISVNCVAQLSPEKDYKRRSSTPEPNGRASGLLAQAKCTCVALATLRGLQRSEFAKAQTPVLQLENGISALITKLLALGFYELAAQELKVLKLCIDEVAVAGTQTSTATEGEQNENLPFSLLQYSAPAHNGPLLSLIITSQFQALRLITATFRSSDIGAVLKCLQIDSPNSLINLIERQASGGALSCRAAAAQQLRSVCNIIRGLCLKSSEEDRHPSQKSEIGGNADNTFQLQVLSFQVQAKWWAFSCHNGSVSEEIFEPFLKYLRGFCRRSVLPAIEKYHICRSGFATIFSLFNPQERKSVECCDAESPILLQIYQELSCLAQDCASFSEANQWLEEAKLFLAQRKAPRYLEAALTCRVAILYLRQPGLQNDQRVHNQLASVARELSLDIFRKGEDIDSLVIAIHELRKSIFSLLYDSNGRGTATKSQLPQQVQISCQCILLQGLQCLRKHMILEANYGPPSDSTQHDHKGQFAWGITKSYIESIILVAKSSVDSNEDWRTVEATLQECIGLVLSFQNTFDLSSNPSPTCQYGNSLLSCISSIYWGRFLQLQKDQVASDLLEGALTISIDLLQKSSNAERSMSLLPIRLEKQGMFYETKGDIQKATVSYKEAIHILLAAGILDTAAEVGAYKPILELFCNDDTWQRLGRLLTAYVKAAMQGEQGPELNFSTVIDDEKLSCSGRGILLERQLNAIEAMLAGGNASNGLWLHLQSIASTLLSVYDSQNFPVRRLRVCCRLLRISSIHDFLLPPEIVDQLPQNVEPDAQGIPLHQDDGLRLFRTHLVGGYNIFTEFCNDTPDIDVVSHSLEAWSALLRPQMGKTALSCYVDDISDWTLQVEVIAEWLDAYGHESLQVVALRLLSDIYALSPSSHISKLIDTLLKLGTQHTKLGNTKEAGLTLHKAETYINAEGTHCDELTLCRWYLSYAKYLLSAGSVEESKQHMKQAKQAWDKAVLSSKSDPDCKRLIVLLTADAASIYSGISKAEGWPIRTLFLCRLRVKLLHGVWTGLQRRYKRQLSTAMTDTVDESDAGLPATMSSMSLTEKEPSPTPLAKQRISSLRHMWSLVPCLFHGLVNLSRAYAHEGLLSEAQYYVEQANKVAKNVPAASYEGRFHAQAGQYKVRSGKIESSTRYFEKALLGLQAERQDHHYLRLQSYLAEKYMLEGDLTSAESALCRAENALDMLSRCISRNDSSRSVETLESRMLKMTLKGRTKHLNNRSDTNAANEKVSRQALRRGDHTKQTSTEHRIMDSNFIHRGRSYISNQRARIAICAGDLDSAERLLSAPVKGPVELEGFVLQTLLKAQLRLRRTIESMASDLTFSILPESTISCPAVCAVRQQQAEGGSQITQKAAALKKGPNRKDVSKSAVNLVSASHFDFRNLLQQTQDELSNICTLATKSSSTAANHTLSDILSRALLMLCSISTSSGKGIYNPMSVAFVTEIGRLVAAVREKSAIQMERQLLLHDNAIGWPTDSEDYSQCCPTGLLSDSSAFREQFWGMMPESWTVIAMSSSISGNEIRLVKLQPGREPFALAIPLERRSSQQADGETFNLGQARAEIQDIINLANYSSQSTPDTARKGAKAEWWEARAALDGRIKNLLLDIENTWFGGFRGVFRPAIDEEYLFLRFERTFESVLDRHLPSRQKQAKNSKAQKVNVDRHVLELFTALGNPNDTDLDEDLTDLLYFVTDILQFHGERNAYDEIDFDSITVEILDALRQYHAASESTMRPAKNQHTILILDKALHSFPWESLQCLKGRAVSRLPSLHFLRDRILQHDGLAASSNGQFTISRSSGTYVLNPSGDLTATQSRFEESLSELSDWESIVNREPKEMELKEALETSNVFLYFGHGSGGQYIRSRTVKRLDKCAVALLMGCSSGTMTEAGTYESYGTPMNYMHAGCPALLATLWDVTDKDIDRFSQTTLEKWGLFERQAPAVPATTGSPVKRGTRRKGKQKEADATSGRRGEGMSLDQAVAESRDSCIMKYLNGAAPVVYGIPVFLS
ncbi:MAG: hypothetical protein Q9191_001615 [Dirinaria sp. TL-2023a]